MEISARKPVVLIVDDEPGTVAMVKEGLEQRDYLVLAATSGPEGLGILSEAVPDIIVIDLRMSPMSGFDMFQEIRKHPRCRTTPVVFFTAVNDPLARRYSETLGVDAYVTKPVDLESLDAVLRERIVLHQSAGNPF